ncbi:helix-turn-helix transcriptional regulator [Methanimicrococcus sp. OttesenSCG-928-J09]|nr:helix-turn-helix transcriptional regulator [Methanimicrococcus sp. OttesenSCG-928-J09]
MKDTIDQMYICSPPGTHIDETPFGYTLGLISGKYKMIILYWISEYEEIRYNQLKRCIQTISDRTLSQTLKELEADGLVIRKEFSQIPPKVEYSLSERGESLIPLLDFMCMWGHQNRPDPVDGSVSELHESQNCTACASRTNL